MWTKWLPWRFMIRQAAKKNNVLDPFEILSQISRFAQPADVVAPSELLRAGFIFHARGLINSQAIQHNLDWVWPYWVERQFNPKDQSFIPRAFSLTHVNLTHRNWTAVGLPDSCELPIVDPRGLLTPFWDGWSLDCWLINDDGKAYVPSRSSDYQITQKLVMDDSIAVVTNLQDQDASLSTRVEVISGSGGHVCRLTVKGFIAQDGWIAVSLRPFNPEGVSFIKTIEYIEEKSQWLVGNKQKINFKTKPQHNIFSYYRQGDVFSRICKQELKDSDRLMECHVGMATAAALFRVKASEVNEVCVEIPLMEDNRILKQTTLQIPRCESWPKALNGLCHLRIPDKKMQFLYDAAVRTMILHSVEDIYPGPYTYKRFWFRDAVLILNAMLSVGMIDRAQSMLDKFPKRQTVTGYFRSQEGEWDSNGQVLWIIDRFYQMSGKQIDKRWHAVIKKGEHWIRSKRMVVKNNDALHDGLLPAGFSAEHFGPNDYYYWDDFWSIAGLKSAARCFREFGDSTHALIVEQAAKDLLKAVEKSLGKVKERTGSAMVPSSPYRRMDSGAIGSIVSNYPLQIFQSQDMRVLKTAEYLYNNCLIDNGFFHDMSHSGINPYLTLHLAQVLLRAGDEKFSNLIKTVADLASPTGQWPEAIHPITKGGCMGDGQHVWAAAEWVMMIRNCFVREEGERLILCSGLFRDWLSEGESMSFGPAKTLFGELTIDLKIKAGCVNIEWKAHWHQQPPIIEIMLPGTKKITCSSGESKAEIYIK